MPIGSTLKIERAVLMMGRPFLCGVRSSIRLAGGGRAFSVVLSKGTILFRLLIAIVTVGPAHHNFHPRNRCAQHWKNEVEERRSLMPIYNQKRGDVLEKERPQGSTEQGPVQGVQH